MVRIRKEWDPDPDAARAIIVWHDGDPYPGPGRSHWLQIVEQYQVPGVQHALVYLASLELASLCASLFSVLPQIIQDICTQCHPTRPVNNWPRWHIYRGQDWPVIVPASLHDWL